MQRDNALTALSIELECRFVVLLESLVQVFLEQVAVANHEPIEFRAQETAERILRRAYDRLSAHIKARVQQYDEQSQQLKARIRALVLVGLPSIRS